MTIWPRFVLVECLAARGGGSIGPYVCLVLSTLLKL
uniref:Uncharacterized protein n=1 Tax=Burkholderia sp. (strain CCGE1003) TaxID=640512 RepID=E1TA95_BURSG